VPSGKFECSLGIHARRNCNHSGRGVQSEERARDLRQEEGSPGAWVLVSILVSNFSSLCIIERAVVLQWEVSQDDVSEYGKNQGGVVQLLCPRNEDDGERSKEAAATLVRRVPTSRKYC